MAQSKPTILVIHGAWHHPAYFQRLTIALQKEGYDTCCPLLPTCNNAVPPNMSFEDDVKLIRETVISKADEGKEIVALMHSYGGIVGTDALYGLSLQNRSDAGSRGGVRRLLYMCAFMPHNDQSVPELFGGAMPPWVKIKDDGLVYMENPEMRFYSDMDPADAKHWAAQLVVHPASAQCAAVTHEAYRDIPVTYLFCENDQGLPIEAQKMMVGLVEAQGVKVDYETCLAGHSPFLSMPDKLAEIICKVTQV